MVSPHLTIRESQIRAGGAGVIVGLGSYFVIEHLSKATIQANLVLLYDLPFIALSVALLYSGYWLLRSDFSSQGVGRVALWSVVGFLALLAIAVWLRGGRAIDFQGSVAMVIDVGTVGASSGLLVGLEGERRRIDYDARGDARRAEERLAFFNRLLRHHLLNGITVVQGYADLLADSQENPPEEIEIIRRRSDQIADLVRNVETLGQAVTGELPTRSIDPLPPLRDAIKKAQAECPETPIEADLTGTEMVQANDQLETIFDAVLAASIDAAQGGPVAIAASADHEFVVSFAFEGSLSHDIHKDSHPGDHGERVLGLYLADTLIEYFGGSLKRTPEDNLIVRLPLA